mmetsp:Transcript_3069/g.8799  ORF Transcript_3069/g.8799 Transcript_3069/m.8799 type:complete len:351 (+) Transcript_3069:592-1644(+)
MVVTRQDSGTLARVADQLRRAAAHDVQVFREGDEAAATAARAAAAAALPSLAISPLPHRRTAVMMRVSTSYAAIPDAKKFYVLSNLVKAAVLLSYTPVAARTLYLGMVNDEWRTTSIRNLGVLYAIPDTVSLLLVERMALTTRIHHLCVIVFMVINLFNDYSERNVWRALVVYAVFSTFAYLVNLLLASRFLAAHAHARASTIRTPTLCTSLLLPLAAPWPLPLPSLHTACSPRPPLSPTSLATACAQVHPSLSYWLSAGALVIYTSCLAANWAWQVHYLTGLWVDTRAYSILAYVGVILLVVWDDVVLVKWLVGNLRGGGTKSASAQQQQQQQQKRASGAAPAGKEKPA